MIKRYGYYIQKKKEVCEFCGEQTVEVNYYRYVDCEGKKKFGKNGSCPKCGKYSYSVTLWIPRWWNRLLFALHLYRTDYKGVWS